MIWNERILFLHTPKTAGMSMTRMLINSLPGQVFVTGAGKRSAGIGRELKARFFTSDARLEPSRVNHLDGKRHETLYDAESFFTYRNQSVHAFERIFAVMRNPYDLELSRFSYLRKGLDVDRGPAQEIALKGTLKDYLLSAPFFGMNPPKLHLYFTLNSCLLDNLTALRFERLERDIQTYLLPYLNEGSELTNENQSKHPAYRDAYDAECEELCFLRHRWFFEKGFYEREVFPAALNMPDQHPSI